MSGEFITNINTQLSEYISKTLPDTEKFQALVGYFYFSGFAELYKELADKEVQILVGMDTDILTQEVVEINKSLDGSNDRVRRENFIEKLVTNINKGQNFDTKNSKEGFDVFLHKIQDESLKIRQTREPNHAKLYIFHYQADRTQGGQQPGMMITGSSNLTQSGLSRRYELNAVFRDKASFQEAVDIFTELREDSIEITVGGKDDLLVAAIKEQTRLQLPTPFECYIKVLHEYFNFDNDIRTPHQVNKNFTDVQYQIDAIKKGIQVIEQHNGVIVADVVGLGKSIIGSMIIHNIQQKENGTAIIIAKPHLVPQWEDYIDYFDLKAKVYSSGALDKPLEDIGEKIQNAHIVLVDEAHKFRNDNTKSYQLLDRICKGRKVILLTATPFNNAPSDIFNLVKLYELPKQTTLEKGLNLGLKFNQLQKQYEKIKEIQRDTKKNKDLTDGEREEILDDIKKQSQIIATDIRNLIEPFLIRRSRLDLQDIKEYAKDLKEQGYEFSIATAPQTWNFDLGNLEKHYVDTLQRLLSDDDIGEDRTDIKLREFTTARYTPLLYIKPKYEKQYTEIFEKSFGTIYSLITGRQENMPFFIKRLLVSRFESSLYAFKQSLSNMYTTYEKVLEWVEKHQAFPSVKKGSIYDILELDYNVSDDVAITVDDLAIAMDDDVVSAFNDDDIDFSSEIDKDKNTFVKIKLEHMEPLFLENLKKDRAFLKDLYDTRSQVDEDPKFDYVRSQIDDIFKINRSQTEYQDRKIIIFSQYADTTLYLYDKLSELGYRVLSVTGGEKTKTKLDQISQNFDAGLSKNRQHNDFDILVATDAVSEGYNLHRAGVIINYDIPYNPIIVIQRAGRINRINKKVYPKLYMYNNFPSLVGAEIFAVEGIAKLKIDMINTILGADTKTITDEEKLASYYTKLMEESEQQEGKSRDSLYLDEYLDTKKNYPDIFKKALTLPDKVRVQRSHPNQDLIVSFGKKGKYKQVRSVDKLDGTVQDMSYEDAFAYFKANSTEQGQEVSPVFYDHYAYIKSKLFDVDASQDEANLSISKALGILKKFESHFPARYLEKLRRVFSEGGYDTGYYLKLIRTFNEKQIDEQVGQFMKECPNSHLDAMIANMDELTKGDETIIISEEFSTDID